MKIYFPETGSPFIADYASTKDEPKCKASFVLKKTQSTFVSRYDLKDEKLVDLYPDLKDDQIAQQLFEEAEIEAERIAAEHAAAQVKAKTAEQSPIA
jgi:hypothetical protein